MRAALLVALLLSACRSPDDALPDVLVDPTGRVRLPDGGADAGASTDAPPADLGATDAGATLDAD